MTPARRRLALKTWAILRFPVLCGFAALCLAAATLFGAAFIGLWIRFALWIAGV